MINSFDYVCPITIAKCIVKLYLLFKEDIGFTIYVNRNSVHFNAPGTIYLVKCKNTKVGERAVCISLTVGGC